MEQLWAPWRMSYVTADKPKGCIFCDKPKDVDDAANYIVWRGKESFVMLNAYPYNNGHMLVAPYAHVADLEEVPAETMAELMRLCQRAVRALKCDFHPEGVNMGLNLGAAAGAGVKDHLHFHVVPRWAGDTNFMPVTADVRVIPQALDESYRLLREAFEALR